MSNLFGNNSPFEYFDEYKEVPDKIWKHIMYGCNVSIPSTMSIKTNYPFGQYDFPLWDKTYLNRVIDTEPIISKEEDSPWSKARQIREAMPNPSQATCSVFYFIYKGTKLSFKREKCQDEFGTQFWAWTFQGEVYF